MKLKKIAFVFVAAFDAMICVGFTGCAPSPKKNPIIPIDPKINLVVENNFLFRMGEGSGRDGLNIFQISANGNCEYLFLNNNRGWRKATFQVDNMTVQELRRLLIKVNFLSLKEKYIRDGRIADGIQWCIRLDAGGGAKKIYCDNEFPESVIQISEFVQSKIIQKKGVEIMKSQKVDQYTADRAAADLWP